MFRTFSKTEFIAVCAQDPDKFTFAAINTLNSPEGLEFKVTVLEFMSSIFTFEGATEISDWTPSLPSCPNPVKSALVYAKFLRVLSLRF